MDAGKRRAPLGRPVGHVRADRAQVAAGGLTAFTLLVTGDVSLADAAALLTDPAVREEVANVIAENAEFDLLDKRVVLQTRIWVDRAAVVHRVEDMSPEYRGAVLGNLAEREPLWLAESLAFLAADVLQGKCDPNVAYRLLGELGRLRAGWMRETPLGRRLLELPNNFDPHRGGGS